MNGRLLRSLAIVIAIAGLIDPAINSTRRTQHPIAIISSDAPADVQLADRLERELSADFAVVRSPLAGAAAVVAAGDRLPKDLDTFPASTPAFAVTQATDLPSVRINAVRAPTSATVQSRVPLSVTVRVERARGRTLDVSLHHSGLTIDRITQPLTTDDERVAVNLTFVPTAEGPIPLTIGAGFEDRSVRERADVMIDVGRRQWAVLAFDRRPSWLSTFVRRALESDPRFVVTSRVITSRNVSTDTGQPPAALDELPSLALFDAVLVGAPEALNEQDVAGLEAFLRRRGGAVCLLLDQQVPGPYERLIGAGAWASAGTVTPASIDVTSADPVRLLATELAWPVRLPPGATPIATSVPTAGDTSVSRPIIWSTPASSGRVIVSGALDAWRFRDASPSAFDRFWRTLVADAAESSPRLVEVQLDRNLLGPGEPGQVEIVVRDAALAEIGATSTLKAGVSVTMDSPSGAEPVRAWPEGTPGRFIATFKAPTEPGTYRVAVTGNGTRVETPFVVASSSAFNRPSPDQREALAAWTTSRGGISVPSTRLPEVYAALDRALQTTQEPTTWYPMRSAWWILPFALCLAAEWWTRRRTGLV